VSDLKSTQSGKLFQTFYNTLPLPKERKTCIIYIFIHQTRIGMVGLFAQLVTLTSSRFLLKRKKSSQFMCTIPDIIL